jgi:hypothetical protein
MQTFQPEDLRAAYRARDLAAVYYLFNPRVTLIDVGWRIEEKQGGQVRQDLAVRVHVRRKPRGPVFEAFAERYPDLVVDKNRIPFPVVDIVRGTYPLQWYWHPVQASARGRVFSPLRGGISISNEWSCNYGTLGGMVKDRDTGEEMILSNWHVLAGSAYASKGLGIYQPGYADGGRFEHTIAHLERHAMNEGIDAAVAKVIGARPSINDQLDIGPASGVTAPMLGMRVIKSGRGSDVTEGVIDGVEGEYPIRYGGFLRKIKHVYRIVPVVVTGQVSTGGDSGSWWLQQDTKKAVALHFAGYDDPETALAIAMPQVLDALNVDIFTEVERG